MVDFAQQYRFDQSWTLDDQGLEIREDRRTCLKNTIQNIVILTYFAITPILTMVNKTCVHQRGRQPLVEISTNIFKAPKGRRFLSMPSLRTLVGARNRMPGFSCSEYTTRTLRSQINNFRPRQYHREISIFK